MTTVLFTGFPGFLGSALLPRILEEAPSRNALCLVQEKYRGAARLRLERIEEARPGLRGRIRLTLGDVRRRGLGLEAPGTEEVTEIFHLAALYDIGADPERLRRVNVDGTRHVLEFAASLPHLRGFHHVSTCYVSGRHAGTFREVDLDVGQTFNNAYEETKYRAEVAVRERMVAGLPATVYRPSIMVGDPRTGRTRKADGPYLLLRWLVRQPLVAVVPVVAPPRTVRVNVVPRDFVVRAMAHLSSLEGSRGRTYHLADPFPPRLDEALDAIGRALEKPLLRIRLPHGLVRGALQAVPALERWTGVPRELVDYLRHPTRYDTREADRALSGTEIAPPSFTDYAGRLVSFLRDHPEVTSEPMA